MGDYSERTQNAIRNANEELKRRANTSHTPGPWKYDDTWGLITAENGAVEVAACHAGRGADSKANARLIACAPELLATLKAVQSRLCEHCPQYMDAASEQVGDHTDECLEAQDVIAKAEGKQ